MQKVLFHQLTSEQAKAAYRRAADWGQRQTALLREEILVPYFGGCCCRQHNCAVNWHYGTVESSVNGKSHRELAQLSKQYDWKQRQIWDTTNRLQKHFAQYF